MAKAAIGEHPDVIVAPPGHRLARKRGLKRAPLVDAPFLLREPGSNETIKQAVMAGQGLALISAHTVAVEIADGRLVTLDVEGPPLLRQWFVVHRSDRRLSPAAQPFKDFSAERGKGFLPALAGRRR